MDHEVRETELSETHELAARIVGRYARYCDTERRPELLEAFMMAAAGALALTLGPVAAAESADRLAHALTAKVVG